MNNDVIQNSRKFYENTFEIHNGDELKSLGFGSRESQEMRFRVLLEVGNLEDKDIADIGCGFGGLLGFLESQSINFSTYTGYDIMPCFIEKALERYPTGRFFVRNILESGLPERYDYVISSGIFCIPGPDWNSYALKMLQTLFDACKIGMAVNFLSRYTGKMDGFSVYSDPSQILSTILDHISNKVILRHDYKPNDFTCYIYRT